VTAAVPGLEHIPPPWGKPLTEEDYIAFIASWISRDIADQALLRRVDTIEGREIVGQKGSRDCAGVLFTNYWPGQPGPVNYRIRRDNPDWVQGKDGKARPQAKYLGAPKSWNRLYIPPCVTPAQLADVKIPIIIVEGEKKALALWRLANHGTDYPRFIPIGIAGVWAWRGIVAKIGGPKGQRVDVKGVISDFDRIQWTGRRVRILFDANVQTNDSVKWARTGIARELATRKSEVDFINLPEDCPVNGVDDLLALWGPTKVLELFDRAVPATRLQIVQPPDFRSRPDGMYRIATKGQQQITEIKLTNYQAAIIANILLDDGVSTAREFEIKGEILGGHFDFTLPAQEFASMDWPIDKIGPAAITYPNQREYARTAIQSFSMATEERRFYAHTGWRKIDGVWVYLHAGGGVGKAGALPDVGVRLSGPMNSFDLRTTEDRNILIASVRASLRLCEVGPASICFPILAATYRAAFGGTDFSLHLAGPTGTFKTELAALHQQHFGVKFDSRHLPGSWSSTANSLESLAFQAKDTLLAVDDFAPNGSNADIQRYHAAADRVFRAAGNHAGRGRMDSTTRLRESKPPRCLILSTGEEIPRGQSVRARLLILELSKGGIDLDKLTTCQKDALEGHYIVAMIGFIQWIAGRYEELQAALVRRVDELRVKSLESAAHARTPGIVASLQAGFELYLEYADASEALEPGEAQNLAYRCWAALGMAAAEQGKHQAATDPVGRYLSLLRASLSSGRSHLAGRRGGPPDRVPEACGWRRTASGNSEPQGDCIGWVDGDDLYLEPAAAYRLIQIAGRDRGESLEISEQTMNKRLNERKLLVTVDTRRETLTVRKTMCGCLQSVLHLSRATILPEGADDDAEY
jgi:hypothetical protein